MKFINTCSVVLFGLVLAGCAATPKPELVATASKNIVESWVLIHKCAQQGMLSSDLAASGVGILRNELGGYSYDADTLNAEITLLMGDGLIPTGVGCNVLAMRISERKRQIAANNQAAEFNQRQSEDFVKSTRANNTYCNKIGQQIFCNTF